jgi:CO/xanthine dehydrogenase FAD-binding subunit
MGVHVAASLPDALTALADRPGAHVLAGGTDFMVEVNFGHRRPEHVVALHQVPELRGWYRDGEAAVLGAGLTYTEMLAPQFAALVPAMAQAARTVGSPQIRNAGTIGGNLGTCSPAGDGLPVLSALDATIELASAAGRRTISIHQFMVGVKRTALQPGEIVVAARVPVLAGYQGFAKVGVRNAMVISAVSACLAVDRRRRNVRLALGAVGPTVLRAPAAEAWAAGELPWDGAALADGLAAEFGRRAAAEARPIDDHRSTAAYRRHAVAVLAGRLLRRAFP